MRIDSSENALHQAQMAERFTAPPHHIWTPHRKRKGRPEKHTLENCMWRPDEKEEKEECAPTAHRLKIKGRAHQSIKDQESPKSAPRAQSAQQIKMWRRPEVRFVAAREQPRRHQNVCTLKIAEQAEIKHATPKNSPKCAPVDKIFHRKGKWCAPTKRIRSKRSKCALAKYGRTKNRQIALSQMALRRKMSRRIRSPNRFTAASNNRLKSRKRRNPMC